MIIDKLLQVSSSQALTATARSTDTVDLGSDRDIGPGRPLWLLVASKVAPGGTSPTIKIAIRTDDNAGFASAAVLAESQTLDAAGFAAGKLVAIGMPFTNERYLEAYFTLGGTSPSFTVDAWFTDQDPTSWAAMPDGI